MPKKCFFTVNLLIRSDSNIKKAVSSVIDNEKFFIENVQLVLIDSVGSELSTKLCTEYTNQYPENIYFVDAIGQKPAESYNHAGSLAFGTYITYIDNYGIYSKGTLPSVMNMLKSAKIPVFCCKPMLYSSHIKDGIPYMDDIENGIIRLHDTPDRFILMLGCYFFKSSHVRGLMFDKELRFDYDTKFIVESLFKTHTYVYSDKCSYTQSRPTERDTIRYEPQYSVGFYTGAVREFILPMLKSYIDSSFIMSVMMYLIEVKFSLNADDLYKGVLVGSKVTEFFDACADAMKYIDDTVILNKRLCRICGLDSELPFRFLRMKYKNPMLRPQIDLVLPKVKENHKYYVADNRMEAITMSGEFAAHLKNVLITRSREISADILAINFDKKGMYIDAVLCGCSCLEESDYSVYISVNGNRSAVTTTPVYTLRKFFGDPFLKRYSFRFFVPRGSGKKMDTVAVYFKYGRLAFRINITFSGIHAKLSDDIKSAYTVCGDRVMSYDKKSRSLVFRRATDSLLAISESRFMGAVGRDLGFASRIAYSRIRRLARSMIREKQKKKILIFYDDKGINYNGNLLFRYFFKNKRQNFEPYICVKHNSPERTFLLDAGYDNILETGSAKAKAAILAADYIYATDCDPYRSLGFNENDMLYLRDMIKAKTVSVKNFFYTYQSAQSDNRLRNNTQTVFCSSNQEIKNLLSPVYDYDKSMIHATGLPMLDALTDKKEKLILIAPGDRRLFSIYENSNYYKFSESAFFRTYNNIFSDPKLLSACREKGWKIAVLLPQAVEKYRKLFHTDDVVSIYPCSEQNEYSFISRAAVLVTDYSELQYRFAYLGKSVVYYFPQGLPMNSEHKGENLSSNGFGDIIFENEQLRDFLIRGLSESFKMPEKYLLRRNDFFPKCDKANCKRIFEQSIKMMRE